MESTPNYLDPQVLAELNGLALRTQHVANGFLTGAHRSAHTGSSAEYAQHRPYVPGDDLRHVDWKAFARSDRLYVKQFMDETNLACQFFLDTSGSMLYQGKRAALSKFEYASCLVSTMAWLLIEQGDAVGVTMQMAQGEKQDAVFELPTAANQSQLPSMIQAIESAKVESQGDIVGLLRRWALRTSQPHLITLVSDLFVDQESLKQTATDLRQFGHELIVIQVCDPDERDFPFEDPTEFYSIENSDSLELEAELFRDGYLVKFNEAVARMSEFFQRHSIDFQTLSSNEPLGGALANFLSTRNQRLAS